MNHNKIKQNRFHHLSIKNAGHVINVVCNKQFFSNFLEPQENYTNETKNENKKLKIKLYKIQKKTCNFQSKAYLLCIEELLNFSNNLLLYVYKHQKSF